MVGGWRQDEKGKIDEKRGGGIVPRRVNSSSGIGNNAETSVT